MLTPQVLPSSSTGWVYPWYRTGVNHGMQHGVKDVKCSGTQLFEEEAALSTWVGAPDVQAGSSKVLDATVSLTSPFSYELAKHFSIFFTTKMKPAWISWISCPGHLRRIARTTRPVRREKNRPAGCATSGSEDLPAMSIMSAWPPFFGASLDEMENDMIRFLALDRKSDTECSRRWLLGPN